MAFATNAYIISSFVLRLMSRRTPTQQTPNQADEKRLTLDGTDLKILKTLQMDCRLSYREIARRIGVSTNTALTRIKNLEKAGVIRGYSAVIDAEKLGYDLSALVELIVAKGKLLDVEREVAHHPNVNGVYDITGTTDVMVMARFHNRRELSRFVKGLLAMEYVERTITHVVLNTIKEDMRTAI